MPAGSSPDPLLAVDGPSLLYRAFFALPDSITDAERRPVNALLGMTNLILYTLDEHPARAVVVCFGAEAAAYRKELYEPYHAERPPVPDGLEWQFTHAPEFFAAFGWETVHSEDLEADDLLHSFAAVEAEAGGRALLLTGDRDMFQCASSEVGVLYVKTGTKGTEQIGPEEVRRRYGVAPELVPDFIALRGDASDGLPGAKGVGEKTAADLLRRHGSLEGAIAGWVGEPPRVRSALRDQAAELQRFKEIATLRLVALERPPDRPTDHAGAAEAARRLGMNRLAERLEKLTA
jgi:DNA polymerase-1